MAAVSSERRFVDNVTKLNGSAFDPVTGLRAGLFVAVPLLLGPAVGYVGAVFAALGGMWLTNTEGPRSSVPLWVLLAACFTESAAVGLGTLAGTAGAIAPVLVGMGVFIPMLVHGNPRWTGVGTFTAVTFAVGVGLPGGPGAAWERALFSIFGTLWVLLGIGLQRRLTRRSEREGGTGAAGQPALALSELHPDALRNAITVGGASAVGFLIGTALGLPRDFWVVVTIILTVQPSFNSTLTFTSSMTLGTIVGAVLGTAVFIGAGSVYVELLFVSAFAILMFAVRGVNLALVQVFLAPFIIILLDLLYGGGANFAGARVIDVSIGGLVSVATVYVLGLDVVRKYWKMPA